VATARQWQGAAPERFPAAAGPFRFATGGQGHAVGVATRVAGNDIASPLTAAAVCTASPPPM